MQLTQRLAQAVESACRRLDYEQPLRCRLDLVLPAIYGFNLGSDVDAGCQLPLNQRVCDAPGFFERTASRENKSFVGHIKSVVSNRVKSRVRESRFKFSLEAYEAADGDANQVWHIWMAGVDGRRVHICQCPTGRARHRALCGVAEIEPCKSDCRP